MGAPERLAPDFSFLSPYSLCVPGDWGMAPGSGGPRGDRGGGVLSSSSRPLLPLYSLGPPCLPSAHSFPEQ